VAGADGGDGGPARGGDGDQFGAAVGGIHAVFGQAAADEQVGGALHGLAGQAHVAGNGRDGQGPVEDGTQDLPPGGGHADRPGEALGQVQELAVEPERGQRGGAEQLLGAVHRGAAVSRP
jgi:hypothetical protein